MQAGTFQRTRIAKSIVLSGACVALLLSGCQDGGKSFRKALRGAATNSGSSRGMFGDKRKSAKKNKKVEAGKSAKGKKKDSKPRSTNKDAIVSCPKDARLSGNAPPRGRAQWCEAKGENGKAVRHGPQRKWHKNDKLKESGSFQMGMPHGTFTKRAINGTVLEERQFKDGLAHGARVKFDKKGTRRSYVSHHAGQKHGKFMKWTRDGVLRERGVFYLDLKHGEWITFHRNGQIRTLTTYYQGKKRGPTETYSKDGILVAQGEFFDDQQANRWTTYFNDGTLKSDGGFRDGQKHGPWVTYKKGGAIRSSVTYEEGIVVQQSFSAAARAKTRRRRGYSRGKPFGSRDILGAEPPLPIRPPAAQITPALPLKPAEPSDGKGGWESL